ncbi:MAG: hypothetical protein AAB131_15175 [Actinomycetota bacterium]
MTVDAHALLALQILDSELDQIAGRRKRLSEHAALQAELDALARWTAAGDAQRLSLDAALESIEANEAAGKQLDVKQARLEAQLKTVIAPREAEALMHEIDGVKAKHSALDDVELAAMEQQAIAEAALAELTAAEPAIAGQVAAARAALDEVLAQIAEEEHEVRGRRDAADHALVDSDRAVYASTRKRFGAVGFCAVDRRSCTGCHVDLSQVEFEQVVADSKTSLAECPHCARTLVI